MKLGDDIFRVPHIYHIVGARTMRYSAKYIAGCSRFNWKLDPTVKRNKAKKTISCEKVKRLSITI